MTGAVILSAAKDLSCATASPKRPFAALSVTVVLLLFAACRTARPTGAPVAPLVAVSADDAMAQLQARRAAFAGMKSLMRVRATTGGKTQSFRAQLAVHDLRRMDLIAYTPVGTTALTMHVEADRVKVKNHIENTEWEGGANQLPEPFRFLAASYTPNDIALLILGFPPPGNVVGDFTAEGLRLVNAGFATFEFSPPSFPAKRVVVTRGGDRVEIEHLEVVGQ